MESKNFLLSKTIWINALALIGTLFGINELAPAEFREEIVVTVVAVVNIVLRFMTIKPITLVGAKKLALIPLVGLLFVAQPAQAGVPFFWFAATAITGGAVAVTYEECKAEGLDAKECASKTWAERKPVDYSKMNG